MSHDIHDDHGHAEHAAPTVEKSKTALRSSFFLIIILAGLFICAINFINAMSHDAGDGHSAGHGEAALHPRNMEPNGTTELDAASKHEATAPAAGAIHITDSAHANSMLDSGAHVESPTAH